MVTTEITLTDAEIHIIQDIGRHTGKTLNAILSEAIQAFIMRETFQSRRNLLRQARGMWKNREDLPDIKTLRQEWNRWYT